MVLFEDFHNFFNKNFKFVDEEKTKLVFMKKN